MNPSDSPGKVLCDRSGHDKQRDERAKQREAEAAKAKAKVEPKKADAKAEIEVEKKPAGLMGKAREMLKGPSGE